MSNQSSMWLGILYVKKGLLLLVGVYMAWETRKVAIPVLNDSPYIGMNVYNVVLTSVVVVSCQSLLSERTTLAFVVVATLIWTSTTTALCLLFIPKFHAVWRHSEGDSMDPIGESSGLKMECNTRRMVIDDRKELLTRAEIMNRVYLQDISKLDVDINRLEKLLDRDIHHTSIATLDNYSSAIQAEVTELYARLEVDNWDVEDELAARSCLSLCPDAATSKSSNGRPKTLSASENQSSLITLLHLKVDVDFEATPDLSVQNNCIYQLVDKNLLS